MSTPTDPSTAPNIDWLQAWRDNFSGVDGEPFGWWFSGVMYAHVDGLREMPVVGAHSIMICQMANDGAVLWRTIGMFTDLEVGGEALRWNNLFTDAAQRVPSCFRQGHGRYGASASENGVVLTAVEADTQINRAIVSGAITDGQVVLTQSEGKLQGFANMDGYLPPIDAPEITELQTRLSFIRNVESPTSTPRGYFSQVYDALPEWLGFGDKLGSALIKGGMRKAAAGEVVDPLVWAALTRLHPDAFDGQRLRALA